MAMNIAVFGAGYVGCVTAACLARFAHKVWLVEVSPEKFEMLRAGESPVSEPGLQDVLGASLRSGQIVPAARAVDAIADTDLSFVCVGTPSRGDGATDTRQVRKVLREIGAEASRRPGPYVIALRSTVTAQQLREEIIPVLKDALGDRFGRDIFFALNPEFLREGKAIEDFLKPAFVVVGTDHPTAADVLREVYRAIDAPFCVVSAGTASLLKYASNAFHALKVAFANEIASLEAMFGADAEEVMKLFCLDRTLNISPAYLSPGYAFGGSCLPKDLRALNRLASAAGVVCPVLDSVQRSNEAVIQRSFDLIHRLGIRGVTLIGLSFKPGTDDLRESPLVELAERLLGKGYRLRIFDPDVRTESLMGRNLQYVNEHLQHLTSLLYEQAAEALADSQLIVVGKPLVPLERIMSLCVPDARILDLIRCFSLNSACSNLLRLYGTEVLAMVDSEAIDSPWPLILHGKR
jgi:GDP-mannose 6-dehydrogenase